MSDPEMTTFGLVKEMVLWYDEQTDDLQGFPWRRSLHYGEGYNLRKPIPPCTGYEGDYEENEAHERNAGGW
jgi:hypothetical protein